MSPPLARSIRRPGPRPRWRASVAPAKAPSTFAAIVKGMKTAGTSVPVSENTRSAAATSGHQRRPSNTSSTRLRAPGAQSSTTESLPTTSRFPNTPPAQYKAMNPNTSIQGRSVAVMGRSRRTSSAS
jgi:hypothetical protein